MENRWTDNFLDTLRSQSDLQADQSVKKIIEDGEIEHIGVLFKKLSANNDVPPQKLFPCLASFFEETNDLPLGVDKERIRRGEDVFIDHAFDGALVLLTKSLPEGYEAPNLTHILHLSGSLERHPFHRLLSVLQMLIEVNASRGFESGGQAVITAQKLRLLHAGIRHVCPKYLPQYKEKYGMFINHEDMLATIIAFSYLLISGWEKLNYKLSEQEKEDYFYVWRVFAVMMGIHPPGEPGSFAYVPDNVEDARLFYDAYQRRHYVNKEQNPEGVSLANANLKMLQDLIPWYAFVLKILPRIYMEFLMGADHCARLGIRRVWGGPLIKWVLMKLPLLFSLVLSPFQFINNKIYSKHHRALALILFQYLIKKGTGGVVTFTVPQNLKEWMDME